MLLVDDNLFNLETLKQLLQIKFKTVPAVANDGLEALNIVKKRLETCNDGEAPFKLILMDIHMPKLNGYESTSQILEACRVRNCSPPYIVALTAFMSEEVRANARQVGMKEAYLKPMKADRLSQILERLNII